VVRSLLTVIISIVVSMMMVMVTMLLVTHFGTDKAARYHVRDVTLVTRTSKQTHTHLFNGPFSGTTRVSRYQIGKTNLKFTEAYASLHLTSDNHASTPPLSFFTGRMPFLPPNQQRQSTEGTYIHTHTNLYRARNYESESEALAQNN